MKKATILVAVAALMVALLAGTATAESKKGPGGGSAVKTYNFEGTIAEIGEDSVVVEVTKGNKAARPFVGQAVPFAVTAETKIEVDEAEATLSDLVVGDEVSVQSRAPRDAQSFTARKIEAEAQAATP